MHVHLPAPSNSLLVAECMGFDCEPRNVLIKNNLFEMSPGGFGNKCFAMSVKTPDVECERGERKCDECVVLHV